MVTERPWQSLVRELRDTGFESPYLDRLRVRHDVTAAQEELEKEIIREMAEALGRAGEKVDVALLRLDVAGRALAAAADADERGGSPRSSTRSGRTLCRPVTSSAFIARPSAFDATIVSTRSTRFPPRA